MIPHRNAGLIYAMLASGMLARDNGLGIERSSEPAQTNQVAPDASPPEKESRQVRRHRLRMEAKRLGRR